MSVTVSISQAENVSLPLVESVGLIEAGLSVNEVRRFKALLDAAGKPGADGVRCVDGPAVFVVTEVYIARAIDFRLSLAAESAAKAKAAVDLSNRPNAAALVTAVKSALFASAPTVGAPASGMTPAAPASAAAAKPPSDVEQQIALALTRRLADAGAFGGVSDMGAAVSVSQGSFGTLNLRTRFLNPPVVGVRGAIITFDSDSMACKVGPSGGGLQAARTSMPLSGVGVEPSTEVTPVPPKDSAQNAGPAK